MINFFERKFHPNKILSILAVALISISCGYQYIEYQLQFEKYSDKKENLHKQYQEIRWETIESILGVLNREGKLHSKLVAHILKQDIISRYPDMSVLQSNLNQGDYNDEKFTSIIINTVTNNGFLGEATSRNGVLISCDDKILYNLIIRADKFDNPTKDFISQNYNVKLAENSFDSINKYRDDLKLLEPVSPVNGDSEHKMLETSSLAQLKEVFLKEGLEGLSGYLLINPFYITKSGDIFNVPDFGRDGLKSNNHKIIVVSYISIYDIIKVYHNERLTNLYKLENAMELQINEELRDMYFSSIKSVLLHFVFILILLIFNKNFNKEDNE